jgi:hypothetical protein
MFGDPGIPVLSLKGCNKKAQGIALGQQGIKATRTQP